MIRNLKVLSLALVAVCAMSAMIASAASAASFTAAGGYPSTITGEGGIAAAELFTLGAIDDAAKVECSHSTYHGTLSAASSTLTISPTYSECKAFSFVGASVTPNGCTYVFHATSTTSSTVDVECPAGKEIIIKASTCEVGVGTQTGLKSAGTKNNGSHVDVTPNVSGIVYKSIADGFLCPLTGTGSGRTGASYTSASAITVKGSNGAISVS